MDELSIDVQWTVVKAAAIISHHITQRPEDQSAVSREPPILTISSGRLFEVEVEVRNEDTVQFEICFRNKKVEIRPAWKTKGFPSYTISRYIERLGETIRMCVSNSDKTITECLQPTKGDINDIWNWNHRLPPTHNSCMHDIVSEQARKFPDKVGISSWDGNLTYAQIDYYSTIIAKSLINIGIKMHDFLPVCFEKSRWTIVAVLAAMKSGATFVLMDPTLPLARLQNMAEQVGATAIISSRNQQQLAISIIPNGKYLVVEEEAFRNHSTSAELPVLAAVPSSVLMYIIFTSGSTGIPKGVKISHETYTSSATPRAKAVGYTEESRVLDFASYAFDVSIDSMLLTLGNGGCLCIPSDEDRVNDINGVIRKMRINYAGLTPSVARILDPDVITSLSALGLGGEAASASDVTVWGRDTRIVIGYGPCECTIGCTINSSAATGRKYVSLGKGNGAAIWITDSNDHDLLMPVGSVGELLVEGPIVGQGYLNDPEKTAAAFINDPKWLLAGSSSYTGRQGRLYKTGDLGMYDPDGSAGIIFVGRKDTQVKLRGQRVELGEIESQLRAKLPPDTTVIAEVLVTLGSGGQLTLVIFLASESAKLPQSTALTLTQLSSEMRERLSQIDIELARVLPRYMVPTAYIPVNYIPALISGKTDRKRLKQFGATVDLRELERDASTSAHRELNDLERRLRQAWSQTLKVTPESIGINDNFFALGGDSLMAMKLVTMCRAENLDLTVASTFSSPTLSLMANVVKSCHSEARESIPPFSMCSRSAEDVCYEASQACHTIPAAIEDVYLCTPTQESLFTFSLKSAKVYVAQRVALIPQELGLDAWKNAWETVVTRNPILRTRLAQMHEPGLQQVVLKENISWKYSTHLQLYLEQDRTEKMELGESLARYAVVDEVDTSHRYMVWTVHHVLYDGWSEPIILQQVSAALHSRQIEITAQMKDFVRYVRETDQQEMQDYWRQELKGATGPQFPKLPSRDYLPIPDAMLEHRITLERSSGLSFTMAALIRGAWALVASQYTRSDDVVFGETLTGRDIALPDVGSIVGPLIGTVPVRIRIDRMTSVESYLQAVQQTMSARIRYQHMGMQNIRKVSQDAQYACEAGTGLVIQPEAEYVGGDLGFEKGDAAREALHFNPYPLMLACGIRRGGLRICASFDSSLIEISQMERMLAQLEMTCIQMINKLSQNLCEISCLSESEINQIWRWNQLAPLSLDASINQVRAPTYIKQQSIYPPAIVSWVCDPQYPSLLCPIGAVGEVWLEGTIVSEDSVDSPEWLVAGSSAYPGRRGRVHPTGDLVLLREDNSLVFVGRKEEVSAIQGHAVDIAGLEAHLDNVLPGATRSAVVISQPLSGNTKQEQRLLIFIEHSSFEEDDVELSTMKHTINASPQNFETSVCAQIPASLALTLKKVDKFIEDSLPSHLAPSGYIPLKEFPMESNQVSHTLLNQLASEIPEEVLLQLNGNLKTAWKAGLAQMTFTEFESILRSAWAVILGIELEKIDVDDNFFRLGGDSVLAMKLASNLRIQGFRLTVRDVFEHMRLGDAAKIMKPEHVQELAGRQPYKPLSLLKDCDVEAFLKQDIRPKLADQNWGIQDVSPVTYVQAMDVRATIRPPRTSIQYTILSFGSGTKREQLFRACQDLIKTHDILRTVFIEHESHFLQVVLHELAITITTEHTNSNLRDYVKELCVQDAKSGLELGVPFVKFLHVVQEETQCLILRLSHAQYDGVSLPRLLQDLGSLYEGFDVAEYEPYPSYIARTHEESAETKAIAYWLTLLNNSSLSILAGSSVQLGDKSLFQHKAVDIFQKPDQITIANILTAAWALLLARRLQKSDVTFGSISSGRNINGIYLENVQGPCYQFTPFRVRFQSQWTAIDLLRFVQRQSAESSVYDFLGFEKISTDCTNWSSQSHFFDSVVHYQDVIEDSDSMPFGGGNCQVDTWNPDGDAAHPLKIVSYVRGGQTYVGVVGSERDPAFVDTTLDEVASAVEELVLGRSEDVLLDGQIFSVG
ncbi:non-ribosomal peptide synthetase module [Tothia fuscella]|uniref:Non-ribosomal peptide synthetase module n=1 Tax=Tothia fuscella TaxID=1048955 RepID=A0A9P4TVQ0_9PEZI|nr:non-ribosomal peptide synthetase module [Tothia fuscella]